MKRVFSTIGLVLTLICSAESQPVQPAPTPENTPKPDVELPFLVGEILDYHVYWGLIHVGETRCSTQWIWQGDRWLIEIKLRTKSNSVLTKLYPVDDTIISEVDPYKLRPLTYTKIQNEGRHHSDAYTEFDWVNMKGNYRRTKNGKLSKKEYDIKEDTRDIPTFLYVMRGSEMMANQVYQYNLMADEKLWDMRVNTRKIEKVKLKGYGKVESLRVEPKAAFEGIFVRKGEMIIWVSQDERQIMTKMVADTPFANIKLILHTVSGPGDDFWVEEQKKPTSKARHRKHR